MKKTKPASNVKTLRAIRDRLNKKLEGLSSDEVLAYFKSKRGNATAPSAARPRKPVVRVKARA